MHFVSWEELPRVPLAPLLTKTWRPVCFENLGRAVQWAVRFLQSTPVFNNVSLRVFFKKSPSVKGVAPPGCGSLQGAWRGSLQGLLGVRLPLCGHEGGSSVWRTSDIQGGSLGGGAGETSLLAQARSLLTQSAEGVAQHLEGDSGVTGAWW